MKYFTKQWYMDCQCSGMHFPLEESREAETLSEEYFQELYKQRYSENFESECEMHRLSGDKLCCDESSDKMKEDFARYFSYNEGYYKERLPQSILKDVADIRVLALHKATKRNIRRIRAFANKKTAIMYRTVKRYRAYYRWAERSVSKYLGNDYSLHDFEVEHSFFDNDDFILCLNGEGEGSDITQIRFEDAKIVLQEHDFNGSRAIWLYDELYKIDKGVEMHVLFDILNPQARDILLSELIIQASYIRYQHGYPDEVGESR